MAYYSSEFEQQTEWLSMFADIQALEFVKVFPRDGVARFKVIYWDASDDSDYGREGGLRQMVVDFPYDLEGDSDEDGDYYWVDLVGLGGLEGKLSSDEINYMYDSISEALDL